MAVSILFALAISTPTPAGSIMLDHPIPIPSIDDLFQYDDGTANWLTWVGLYRGVWFNTQDFVPGAGGAGLGGLEFWFFHHSSYPWDISSFSAELWNGRSSGPADLLEQTSVTAVHYAPCYADYSPTVWCERNFWGLVNSHMSSGGWPALLGDNTPNPASHSFFSDDFIVWEPWIIGGATANDYFIRAVGGG
jgi:hypothetical protein